MWKKATIVLTFFHLTFFARVMLIRIFLLFWFVIFFLKNHFLLSLVCFQGVFKCHHNKILTPPPPPSPLSLSIYLSIHLSISSNCSLIHLPSPSVRLSIYPRSQTLSPSVAVSLWDIYKALAPWFWLILRPNGMISLWDALCDSRSKPMKEKTSESKIMSINTHRLKYHRVGNERQSVTPCWRHALLHHPTEDKGKIPGKGIQLQGGRGRQGFSLRQGRPVTLCLRRMVALCPPLAWFGF